MSHQPKISYPLALTISEHLPRGESAGLELATWPEKYPQEMDDLMHLRDGQNFYFFREGVLYYGLVKEDGSFGITEASPLGLEDCMGDGQSEYEVLYAVAAKLYRMALDGKKINAHHLDELQCFRCATPMRKGVAIKGYRYVSGVTTDDTGVVPATLVDCMKCPNCGYSEQQQDLNEPRYVQGLKAKQSDGYI